MAWALYLSNATATSVTDAQLAELDDYELAVRAGSRARDEHLSHRIGHIVHALVCAAGAIKSRSQMLRSVTTLHTLLTSIGPDMLQTAVRELVTVFESDPRTKSQSWHTLQSTFSPTSPSRVCEQIQSNDQISPTVEADPPFLRPLVSIAVNRVSDAELSTMAAEVLAILLGHPSFDEPHKASCTSDIPPYICTQTDVQLRRLIAMLITEIVLTSSPRALAILSRLLRRDTAREIFCEKDGVSTLASTLQTQPDKPQTAIGEQVATVAYVNAREDPVYASYHAVFSLWMLTFATRPRAVQIFLENVVSSRLVVILARLLNHASGQRLKIARVTLAAAHNMALGETSLHHRVRRDMVAAHVPSILRRLMQMASVRGSLMGNDDDAVADARTLLDKLEHERAHMTTVDAYVAEVRAGALHASPVHIDSAFWAKHSNAIVEHHHDVLTLLFNTVCNELAAMDKRVVACHDLANLIQNSAIARRSVLKNPTIKSTLMALMVTATDPELKKATLLCVQLMLIGRTFRSDGR